MATTSQLEAYRDRLLEAYGTGALEVTSSDGKRVRFDDEAGLLRRLRAIERLLSPSTQQRPGVSYAQIQREDG